MKKELLFAFIILSVILASGCSQERKLPAIKVVFMHYDIKGQHILKIKKVEPAFITKKEAPTLYPWYNTPFPSIILFAYDWRGGKLRFVTPSTCLPIETEGDNITAYIGFKDPKHVPKNGDGILVVVQVANREGRILAYDEAMFVWNVTR